LEEVLNEEYDPIVETIGAAAFHPPVGYEQQHLGLQAATLVQYVHFPHMLVCSALSQTIF
jgi:hypothetical protein